MLSHIKHYNRHTHVWAQISSEVEYPNTIWICVCIVFLTGILSMLLVPLFMLDINWTLNKNNSGDTTFSMNNTYREWFQWTQPIFDCAQRLTLSLLCYCVVFIQTIFWPIVISSYFKEKRNIKCSSIVWMFTSFILSFVCHYCSLFNELLMLRKWQFKHFLLEWFGSN